MRGILVEESAELTVFNITIHHERGNADPARSFKVDFPRQDRVRVVRNVIRNMVEGRRREREGSLEQKGRNSNALLSFCVPIQTERFEQPAFREFGRPRAVKSSQEQSSRYRDCS